MIKVTGQIKTVKRIRYKNQECDGIAYGDKQNFLIKIVESTLKRDNFIEVLLHELMHVWFFIVLALYKIDISERKQHKIIEAVAPRMSRQVQRLLRKKK